MPEKPEFTPEEIAEYEAMQQRRDSILAFGDFLLRKGGRGGTPTQYDDASVPTEVREYREMLRRRDAALEAEGFFRSDPSASRPTAQRPPQSRPNPPTSSKATRPTPSFPQSANPPSASGTAIVETPERHFSKLPLQDEKAYYYNPEIALLYPRYGAFA